MPVTTIPTPLTNFNSMRLINAMKSPFSSSDISSHKRLVYMMMLASMHVLYVDSLLESNFNYYNILGNPFSHTLSLNTHIHIYITFVPIFFLLFPIFSSSP